MITTKQILTRALALIDTPEKWTKGAFALGADGEELRPQDRLAVCWCSGGAVLKAADEADDSAEDALSALRKVWGGVSVVDWNDAPERTHAEVVAAFERAIEAAP